MIHADISLFESLQNTICPVRNDLQTGQKWTRYNPDEDEDWNPNIGFDDLSPVRQKQLMGLLSQMGPRDDLSLDDLQNVLASIQKCETPEQRKKVCEIYGIPYDYNKKNSGLLAAAVKMFGGKPNYKENEFDRGLERARQIAAQGAKAQSRERVMRIKQQEANRRHQNSDLFFRQNTNQPSSVQSALGKPAKWISVEGAQKDISDLVGYLFEQPVYRDHPENQQELMNLIRNRVAEAFQVSDGKRLPYSSYFGLVRDIKRMMKRMNIMATSTNPQG